MSISTLQARFRDEMAKLERATAERMVEMAVRAAAEKALKSERKAGKMVRSFHIDLNTVIDPAQLQKESRRIRH